MAGLIGLSLLATLLDHGTLGKCLLMVLGAVLVAGHTQLGYRSVGGSICGTGVGRGSASYQYLSSPLVLADIESWLTARGFVESDPPTHTSGYQHATTPISTEPDVTVWHRNVNPALPGTYISVRHSGKDNITFLAVDYSWQREGFPWQIKKHEQEVETLRHEMAAWWQAYVDRSRSSQSTP
jgi:hypothetical protein